MLQRPTDVLSDLLLQLLVSLEIRIHRYSCVERKRHLGFVIKEAPCYTFERSSEAWYVDYVSWRLPDVNPCWRDQVNVAKTLIDHP